MEYMRERTWLDISLDAMGENYRRITRDIGEGCRVMAVVKANAYGLGARVTARYLESQGCPAFAVATVQEAMELREAGVKADILTLGPVLPEQVRIAAENRIATNIISMDHARALSREAASLGLELRGHVKVDCGMGRFGIIAEGRTREAAEDVMAMAALPGLKVEGVFTHYTAADLPRGDEFNLHQISLFDDVTERLRVKGLSFAKHSASSYFTCVYPQCHNDYVRVGSLLLGLDAPAPRGTVCEISTELKSRIYQIKELGPNMPVSYGPIAHTLRRTRIAVVPIGYADGLRRSIQNRAALLVRGEEAPIIGKICMDYLMLDVTDIPDAAEGDEVVVFGRSGDKAQEVYEMAQIYGATVGEVPTALTDRVPRLYILGGKTYTAEEYFNSL